MLICQIIILYPPITLRLFLTAISGRFSLFHFLKNIHLKLSYPQKKEALSNLP